MQQVADIAVLMTTRNIDSSGAEKVLQKSFNMVLVIFTNIIDWERLETNLKEGFVGGFLILGFALFVGGFILGMLANSLIEVNSSEEIMLNLFILGLLIGMLTIALLFVIVKLVIFTKNPSTN